MKVLTKKLIEAAAKIDRGYPGLFVPLGMADIDSEQAARVMVGLGLSEKGYATVEKLCGTPEKIHVPQDATAEEKVLLLLFAARLNETGDL